VKDMNSFMAQIDIFVSTALWEGFGFVLAEAMVAKKPVLAFNLSSNPELVKDGENGFLIPPENTGLFAEKLELLINDSSLRKQLGENAYTFAKTNFEKEKQFQKLIDFIK
jgi:glycosyltransferase involved in cell wall biosynthesis